MGQLTQHYFCKYNFVKIKIKMKKIARETTIQSEAFILICIICGEIVESKLVS